MRSSAPYCEEHMVYESLQIILFNPPFKMIEYDSKQSKEIYNALLESKVDLLEYFLGPDPKKTSYYRKHVKRYRVKSILNDY